MENKKLVSKFKEIEIARDKLSKKYAALISYREKLQKTCKHELVGYEDHGYYLEIDTKFWITRNHICTICGVKIKTEKIEGKVVPI